MELSNSLCYSTFGLYLQCSHFCFDNFLQPNYSWHLKISNIDVNIISIIIITTDKFPLIYYIFTILYTCYIFCVRSKPWASPGLFTYQVIVTYHSVIAYYFIVRVPITQVRSGSYCYWYHVN